MDKFLAKVRGYRNKMDKKIQKKKEELKKNETLEEEDDDDWIENKHFDKDEESEEIYEQ